MSPKSQNELEINFYGHIIIFVELNREAFAQESLCQAKFIMQVFDNWETLSIHFKSENDVVKL